MDIHTHLLAFSDGPGADTLALAPFDFTDGATAPPAEFLLIRYGDNDYTKGEERGRFAFSEGDADAILADFAQRGKDGVVDYEHQTLKGVEAPAAGWIKTLVKTAAGLSARVEWTPRARERLRGREYRYHSPVLHFRAGRPYQLHSVALTNRTAWLNRTAIAVKVDLGDGMAFDTDAIVTKFTNEQPDEEIISYSVSVKPTMVSADRPPQITTAA